MKLTLSDVKRRIRSGWQFSKWSYCHYGKPVYLRDTLWEMSHAPTRRHPHVTWFIVDVNDSAHEYLLANEQARLLYDLWADYARQYHLLDRHGDLQLWSRAEQNAYVDYEQQYRSRLGKLQDEAVDLFRSMIDEAAQRGSL